MLFQLDVIDKLYRDDSNYPTETRATNSL